MDTQQLREPLSHSQTDVGYCKWKDPSGEPLRGTPISRSPPGPLPNSPAPGLADAAAQVGADLSLGQRGTGLGELGRRQWCVVGLGGHKPPPNPLAAPSCHSQLRGASAIP